MDRAVRISLFALGIIIGSAFVIFFASTSTNDREFGSLGEEFVQMRAEQIARHEITEIREVSREEMEEALQEESLDDAELETQVRDRGRRRAAVITAAAGREPVDPDWAPTTEQQIAERFAQKAPSDFELISAICKTSICIAEVETPSRKVSTGQMGWHRFFGLSRAYVHHHGEAGSAFRTVVFLARDGHSLPK